MIFHRSIPFAILLFCSFFCRAQDSNYVYKDSAIFYQDSVEAVAKEKAARVETDTNETSSNVADTVLRSNGLAVEPDSVKALKNQQSLAYAKNLDSLLYKYQQGQTKNDDAEKTNVSWIARFFLSPITAYFFLFLGVVFVAVILYKLFFAEGFLQKSYARIKVAALPEEDPLSGTADFEKLIAQAVSNRNYRLAIRYYYLQSLQNLSSKGAIQFALDKTNYEYLRELSDKKYRNAFASLTLNYEYVWYGEFDIDENIFTSIQHKFRQFNSEL